MTVPSIVQVNMMRLHKNKLCFKVLLLMNLVFLVVRCESSGDTPKRKWAIRLVSDTTGKYLHKRSSEAQEIVENLHKRSKFLISKRQNAQKVFRYNRPLPIGTLEGYHLIENDPGSNLDSNDFKAVLSESNHIEWFEEQIPRIRTRREIEFQLNDPLYPEEWFLVRTVVILLNPTKAHFVSNRIMNTIMRTELNMISL